MAYIEQNIGLLDVVGELINPGPIKLCSFIMPQNCLDAFFSTFVLDDVGDLIQELKFLQDHVGLLLGQWLWFMPSSISFFQWQLF